MNLKVIAPSLVITVKTVDKDLELAFWELVLW